MKRQNILMLIIAISILFFLISGKIIAQETKSYNYRKAIGLRVGETSGISFNHRFSERNGIKFIASAFPYSYGLTILGERYYPTKHNRLDFYFGAGGHIAGAYHSTWYYRKIENDLYTYERLYGYSAIIGIDMIGGIEYKLPNFPLVISFDLKPNIEFFNGYGPYFRTDPGFTAKLVF